MVIPNAITLVPSQSNPVYSLSLAVPGLSWPIKHTSHHAALLSPRG